MKTFLRGRYFANGGEIKHIKNRSVTVFKQKLEQNDSPSVCLEFKRADVPKETIGIGSASTVVVKGKAEFTLVSLSREAALSLTMLLQDYWERVDNEWFSNLQNDFRNSQPKHDG